MAEELFKVEVSLEPTFMALGSSHLGTSSCVLGRRPEPERPGGPIRFGLFQNLVCVGVGMNNKAWFYSLEGDESTEVSSRDYVGTVQKMCLNDTYAAVLSGGRCLLCCHWIRPT